MGSIGDGVVAFLIGVVVAVAIGAVTFSAATDSQEACHGIG
jgi:hypothetical protein